MPKYTIAKYAERVGVSRAYLYKLIKQKKIDLFLNGKKKEIDSDQVDPIVKFKPAGRATTKTYQKNGAKRKGKNTSAPDENKTELPELNSKTSIEELDRINAYEKARKARVSNDLLENKYYHKSQINEKSFNLFRQLRDGVQSLKDRVAMKCRSAESDHESRKILGDEIHNILNSIVDGYDLEDEIVKKKLLSLLTQ